VATTFGPTSKIGKKVSDFSGFFRVSRFREPGDPETLKIDATGGVVQAFSPRKTLQGRLFQSWMCCALVTKAACECSMLRDANKGVPGVTFLAKRLPRLAMTLGVRFQCRPLEAP